MSPRKVLSRTRGYLLRLTEFDTKGQTALGENLDEAIKEAYEILSVPPMELSSGDWLALEDLNAAFDVWLQMRARGLN